MVIQRLLAEAGAGGPRDGVVSVDAGGVEMAADWDSLKSPEKYVGYDRTENFASAGGGEVDLRDVNQGGTCLRVRLSRFGEDPPGARFGHRRSVRDPIRVRKWG